MEVNQILDYLEYMGYDTSNLDGLAMHEYLVAIDYSNFIFDQTALDNFFAAFNIDSTTFNQGAYATVRDWLDIKELPYPVGYVLELLSLVNYDVSTVNQTLLFNELNSIDYETFVLDEFAILDLFTTVGIDYSSFIDSPVW